MDQKKQEPLFEIILTEQELNMILDKLPIPIYLVDILHRASHATKDGMTSAYLREEQLDELIDLIHDHINRNIDDPCYEQWIILIDRLVEYPSPDEIEQNVAVDTSLPPEIRERLKELIENKQVQNMDELNECFQQVMTEYHQTPQVQLGGLSPEQMWSLLNNEWGEEHPIGLNKNLTADDVASTIMIGNVKVFLSLLEEGDGKTKLTEKGFLGRKFMQSAGDAMILEGGDKWVAKEYRKSLKEIDIKFVYILRMVADLAGLIRKSKGYLYITKKGKMLLKEENIGKLYRHLFLTFFNSFNIANMDRCNEFSPLQDQFAFSVYRCSQLAKDWINVRKDCEKFVHPLIVEELEEIGILRDLYIMLNQRFFVPMHWFGLMDYQTIKSKEEFAFQEDTYRKTPLFDRFFDFSGLAAINKTPLPIYKHLH